MITAERARVLLSFEHPSTETVCDACNVQTLCYVEPDNLWTHEIGGKVCRPCAARIATGRKISAQPIGLGL